ncbi:hypothetical protein V6N13_016032 [Hibiscus sabdariffa]
MEGSKSATTTAKRPNTRATTSSASTNSNVRSFCKRKRQVGIGLYTNLQTGEQLLNPGFASERVVTALTTVPKKIGSQISRFQHVRKGPGLK